jgi:uncharacterized membrane protein YkvA (DUF1232 family)
MPDNTDFSEHYDEESFWQKIRRFAIRAGRNVIKKALIAYYCLNDNSTPGWARAVIISALGYFIFPLDAIADITPLVGFADDLGVLVLALASVGAHITDDHIQQAEEQLNRWFPGNEETDEDGDSEPSPAS